MPKRPAPVSKAAIEFSAAAAWCLDTLEHGSLEAAIAGAITLLANSEPKARRHYQLRENAPYDRQELVSRFRRYVDAKFSKLSNDSFECQVAFQELNELMPHLRPGSPAVRIGLLRVRQYPTNWNALAKKWGDDSCFRGLERYHDHSSEYWLMRAARAATNKNADEARKLSAIFAKAPQDAIRSDLKNLWDELTAIIEADIKFKQIFDLPRA